MLKRVKKKLKIAALILIAALSIAELSAVIRPDSGSILFETVPYAGNPVMAAEAAKYLAVHVNSVDRAKMLLTVTELFKMDSPDLETVLGKQSFVWSNRGKTTYIIDTNAAVTVNGVKAGLSDVAAGATAVLSIGGSNQVKEIRCVDVDINTEARKIVRGIVEENNPDLGYLALFNEDGTGAGSGSSLAIRIFNYVNLNKTEVYRNHKKAGADDIQPGDTVYIRLDDNGDISSISAASNYTTRYGKVVSKLAAGILVEFDDGSQQLLSAGENVIVVKDRMLVGMNALQDGDRVRLILNENGPAAELKEITIEGEEHFISNIYKGAIAKIDPTSDKITVMGLQVFRNGTWERTEWKGLATIPMADGLKIYAGDVVLDIEDADRLKHANEAYIAVEKTYGGEEKAVVLSYTNSLDTPLPAIKDTIAAAVPGSGSFSLLRENKKVTYSDGSIVVKYGRLVGGNSLSSNDAAYLVLNREYSSGNYYASVVKVDEPKVESGIAIYRGRISGINEGADFTIESFSHLQGTDWKYSNTPKTFNIANSTRILNDDGLMNVRDFKEYGDDSYLNRTVYVVADGVNAVLVSTAPFGIENLKGTVYEKNGDQLHLRKVSVYDASTYMWVNRPDAEINILKNSVIIKNGKVANSASIEKGSLVRVIKKDPGTTGDGYIIFVE